jgi:hypothetical protein
MAHRLKHKARVSAHVRLENGTTRDYSWTTPVPFGRLLGKGGRWAREEMRDTKVPGRSKILLISVTVERIG